MKTADAVGQVAALLAAAGIKDARREARIILAAALGTDAAGLLRHDDIDPAVARILVGRRAAREPLAYILGRREFWGLPFAVSPATLIPRPESETLIEAVMDACPDHNAVSCILDLGTGTGCLLLAALHEFPAAFGVGLDLSPAAAGLARANAAALGLGARASFMAGDWARAIVGRFDVVLSNPPYIPVGDIAGLMPEVAKFEPAGALDGGVDGLVAYRAIIAALPRLLAPGGVAVLELGVGQAAAVAQLAQGRKLTPATRADLAGIPRALVLRA